MAPDIYTLLGQVISQRGFSLAAVSRKLSPNHDPSLLSKILRRKRPLRHDQIGQILDIIGESPARFWMRHLGLHVDLQPPGFADLAPAKLLRIAAGHVATKPPPVVARIMDRGLPAFDHDPLTTLPLTLQDLDQLRMKDRMAALAQCTGWLSSCEKRLLAERPSSMLVAETLTALTAFATMSNSQGEGRLAALVLAFVFEQVKEAATGLAFAYFLWRSGPVLSDSGYPHLAVSFLERSQTIFRVYNQHSDEMKVAVSLGVQHSYLGNLALSKRYYLQCLRHAQTDEWTRLIALSNLAKDHQRLHQPEEAIALIEELESGPLRDVDSRLSANARWIKANALADRGELDQAAEIYAGLRSDIARHGTPIDPMLLFCDYAAVLLRLDETKRLQLAAELALEQIPQLPDPDGSWIVSAVRPVFEKVAANSVRAHDITRLRPASFRLSGWINIAPVIWVAVVDPRCSQQPLVEHRPHRVRPQPTPARPSTATGACLAPVGPHRPFQAPAALIRSELLSIASLRYSLAKCRQRAKCPVRLR